MPDILKKTSFNQSRTSLYCYILNNYNAANEDDYLRRIYLKNFPVNPPAEIPGTMDMIARLARFQRIAKPEDMDRSDYDNVIDVVTMFRKINRLVELQSEYDGLVKIRNPDDYILTKIKAIEKEIQEKSKSLPKEMEKYSLPDTSYPDDIVRAAKEFQINQQSMNSYALLTAQDFVDALRRHDFLMVAHYFKFIMAKYDGIKDVIGADDFLPLLLHELAGTDLNTNDILKINLFYAIYNQIGSTVTELGYFMINLLALPYLFAAKQISPDAFAPSMEIHNNAEHEAFSAICEVQAAKEKLPENGLKEKQTQIENQANFRDSNGQDIQIAIKDAQNKTINVNKFDVEKEKFLKENKNRYFTSVILHLLRNVNIQKINGVISNYIAPDFIPEFNQQLLSFQLQNAYLVKQWQIKLQYGHALARNAAQKEQELVKKLPANYVEYLERRKELAQNPGYRFEHAILPLLETETKTATEMPSGISTKDAAQQASPVVKRDVKLASAKPESDRAIPAHDEEIFRSSIKPRLEAETRQIALKEAKREFKQDRDNITSGLILSIQALIESTDWKVMHMFGIGMKKIPVIRNGAEVQLVVPKNVYRIYQLCLEANQPGADIQAIYKNIQSRGKKASEAFFTLFRHEQTQAFYDTLKTTHEESMARKQSKT